MFKKFAIGEFFYFTESGGELQIITSLNAKLPLYESECTLGIRMFLSEDRKLEVDLSGN